MLDRLIKLTIHANTIYDRKLVWDVDGYDVYYNNSEHPTRALVRCNFCGVTDPAFPEGWSYQIRCKWAAKEGDAEIRWVVSGWDINGGDADIAAQLVGLAMERPIAEAPDPFVKLHGVYYAMDVSL